MRSARSRDGEAALEFQGENRDFPISVQAISFRAVMKSPLGPS